MIKLLYSIALLSFTAIVFSASPASAARPGSTPVGNDISWPQCGRTLPTTHAFGIVGVNDGLANTTNSCLQEQLQWAHRAVGGTSQAKAQLYVNTANPGGLNTPSWPKSNTDSLGNPVENPYGTCDGSDSLACAYMYGWNRAAEDVHQRFIPAATAAGVNADPASYPWWLDVETENTWKTGGTAFDYNSNIADLEGMTEYFQSQGITVGVYSTGYQWGVITGNRVTSVSNLYDLDSWLAGARNLKGAQQNCNLKPLNAGGQVVLTQYVANNLDYDYSCV